MVLVVDDRAEKRYFLVRTLKTAGFATREAATGTEALAGAREGPDLILLDVQLPDLSGFEVCRRLKDDALTASIPVIQLSSAFTTVDDRVHGLRGGADGYLAAPVSPAELVATLHSLLRVHEVARERERRLQAEGAARAALERANAQLRVQAHILDSVQDSIITTDLEGRITYWNRGATALFGYTAEEMLGRSVGLLYPDGGPDAAAADLARVLAGGDYRAEWLGRHKSGAPVWVDARTTLLRDDEGRPTGFVGVSKDATARKCQAEFEQALLGVVSHDLRNPLNAITLSAALGLKHEPQDARTRRAFERISTSAARAVRMIEDLLDFTKARLGGGIPVTRQPVNLPTLVGQVVDELLVSWPGRNVQLRVEGDGGGRWDADRIAQVVQNLVGNALQHSTEEAPVSVAVRGTGPNVLLEVHNGGPPIAPEDMPRLFEPFSRGAGARHGGGRSMGLGLFITRHLVQAHGGQVEVSSREGEGTRFTVSLPRG